METTKEALGREPSNARVQSPQLFSNTYSQLDLERGLSFNKFLACSRHPSKEKTRNGSLNTTGKSVT